MAIDRWEGCPRDGIGRTLAHSLVSDDDGNEREEKRRALVLLSAGSSLLLVFSASYHGLLDDRVLDPGVD